MAFSNSIITTLQIVVVIFSSFSEAALHTVVLLPINKGLDEAALITIPGADFTGESYKPLTVAIQKATPLTLWVGLTSGYSSNVPTTADDVRKAIDMAIEDLQAAGMGNDVPVFVAAHSNSGAVTQGIINSNPKNYAGLLLWASYLTGPTEDLATFPTPVLHLSGDLDGFTRMTRIGRTFRELSSLVATNRSAEFYKTVVLLNGVNHGQFASEPIPPRIVQNDIRSNLSFTEAHCFIAKICSLFMTNIINPSNDAKLLLQNEVFRTNTTLMPLFVAEDFQVQGVSSKWAIGAQDMVANVPDSYQNVFTATSQVYTNQQEFEESKPSVIKDSNGNVLATATVKVYLPENQADNATIEESAVQIAVKTKNQKAVEKILGDGTYGPTSSCLNINQASLRWALERASDEARSRYQSNGRELLFDKDKKANTGSEWVSSPLHYKYTSEGNLVVTSTSLYTDPNFIIPNLAGMYYCKLLSPYRVMEWIYVDSFRPFNPTMQH